MRVALGIQYDGSAFCGWQSQPHGKTVQDELERALAEFAQTHVQTVVAGQDGHGRPRSRPGRAFRYRTRSHRFLVGARHERVPAADRRGAMGEADARRFPRALRRVRAHLLLRAVREPGALADALRPHRLGPYAARRARDARGGRVPRRRARFFVVSRRRLPVEDAGQAPASDRHPRAGRLHPFPLSRERVPAPHGAQPDGLLRRDRARTASGVVDVGGARSPRPPASPRRLSCPTACIWPRSVILKTLPCPRRISAACRGAPSGRTRHDRSETGLGLALAKQLAALMEGEMGVQSQPGRGSTFWFTAELEKQAGNARDPHRSHHNLVGARVLAVDDNVTNRRILRHQLDAWKMQVQTAADGGEALGVLKAAAEAGRPYHAALLDVQMPEMDGWTLARAIRTHPALAGTRLIVLTSVGQTFDPAELKAAGIEAYLVKPVKQSRLFDCVGKAVAGKASSNWP